MGGVHSQYPDVPKPDTTVVRMMCYDERDSVIADCLHEAGFSSRPVADEQLGKLYDYLTIVQFPCLESLGFTVPNRRARPASSRPTRHLMVSVQCGDES